jgi:transcriptional regulator of acetoin/glycerol metabolism
MTDKFTYESLKPVDRDPIMLERGFIVLGGFAYEQGLSPKEAVKELLCAYAHRAFRDQGDSVSRAAAKVGVNRNTIHKWMEKK